MTRLSRPVLAALVLILAACCPVPTTGLQAPRLAEARVEVVMDGAAPGDASARSGRSLADGTALRLEPADGVVLAPGARLYLVGHWLARDTLYVASAHPVSGAAANGADAAARR